MLGPKNKDLKSISDFNSTWADRGALLILGGLVVDIVEVFILGKVWPEWALTIAANSLIAIGVWGELRFAKRARDADDSSCLLYTSPSPRDRQKSRMPSS